MNPKIEKIKAIIRGHGQPDDAFEIRRTTTPDGDLVKVVANFDDSGVVTITTMNNIEIYEDFAFYGELNENIIDDMILFLEKNQYK